MDVVVIGGAGRVGDMVVGTLREQHQVRVADRQVEPQRDPGTTGNVVPVDVTDVASVRPALSGQDALIYLAMGRQAPWGTTGGWVESHFDVNVKGVYLTLRAAADAGVRKVVYASSLSVFDDYLHHGAELEQRRPDALNGYGLTKRLGEEVCAAAAREHNLSITALRLCGPLPDDEWRAFAGRCPDVMTAGSDVAAAFAAALERTEPGFEAFVITGDHDQRFITMARTHELLGWWPRMRREHEGEPT